jgi:hypothetical protein
LEKPVLDSREITATPGACVVTRLDDVCYSAITQAELRSRRLVTYIPDRGIGAVGCWSASRLTRALALLVEEVAHAAADDERIELRWGVDAAVAVIQVHYPRAVSSVAPLVTFCDADATASEDRRRFVAAREALLEQCGTLARVRAPHGTTYVATVPRCQAGLTARSNRSRTPAREEAPAIVGE